MMKQKNKLNSVQNYYCNIINNKVNEKCTMVTLKNLYGFHIFRNVRFKIINY